MNTMRRLIDLMEAYQTDSSVQAAAPTPPELKPSGKNTARPVQEHSKPLLILVHPGSACGSANELLGRSQAGAERDGLILDLTHWNGHVLVVDGDLSDELPYFSPLNNAIQRALQKAKKEKLISLRVFACDDLTENWPSVVYSAIEKMEIGKNTPVKVTGAWYVPNARYGCVNAVNHILTTNGYSKVSISDNAIIDPMDEDDDDDHDY